MIIDDVYKCINSNPKEMKEHCKGEVADWIKGKNLPNKSLDGEFNLDIEIKPTKPSNQNMPHKDMGYYEQEDNEYMDKEEFLLLLKEGEFDEFIINGACIDTEECVWSIIKTGDKFNAILNEEGDALESQDTYTVMFEDMESPYEVIERIANDCEMIRLFYCYALYCEYISDEYLD